MGVESGSQVLGHRSPRQIKWRGKMHRPSRQCQLRIGQNLTNDPLYLDLSPITIVPLLPSTSPDQSRLLQSPKSRKRNWKSWRIEINRS
jgi:hypothetical protein